MKCLLTDYRRDNCASCDGYCAHRIALSGLNGEGGRIASAGLPREYRFTTLSNSPVREGQPKIYELLDKYVATFTGDDRVKSLYLWSENPGTGKSTTASALANEYVIRDYLTAIKNGEQPRQQSAYFLDVNQLQTDYNLATMTNNDAELEGVKRKMRRCMDVPFLVMDDIGIRDSTPSFKSIVHAIINKRTTDASPTVYTSNLAISEMSGVFDARLGDRIRDQCADIHFAGASKRGRR